MCFRESLDSLNIIAEETNQSLRNVIFKLESDDFTKQEAIINILTQLKQLSSIYNLAKLSGAMVLIQEIMALFKRDTLNINDVLKTAVYSLSLLLKYQESMTFKSLDIPELLVPIINELRAMTGSSAIGESYFFSHKIKEKDLERFVSGTQNNSKTNKSFRRCRTMYQAGLVEVLNQTNISGGLKMMLRAMKRFEQLNEFKQSLNLWMLAQEVIESFRNNQLQLTKSRMKVFSLIDRQLKLKITNTSVRKTKSDPKLSELTANLLYLTSISESNTTRTKALKRHFSLLNSKVTDKLIQQELVALNGPGAKEFEALYEAVKEEFVTIENLISMSQQKPSNLSYLNQVSLTLNKMTSLLNVINFDEEHAKVKTMSESIRVGINKKQPLSADQQRKLINLTKDIQQSIWQRTQPQSHSLDTQAGIKVKNGKVQVIHNTRKIVEQAIHMLSQFNEDNKQGYIHETKKLLVHASKGLSQLKLSNLKAALDNCVTFIKNNLCETNSSAQDISILVDIICGVEFYLETMENNHTPHPRVIKYILESMGALKLLIKKNKPIETKRSRISIQIDESIKNFRVDDASCVWDRFATTQ